MSAAERVLERESHGVETLELDVDLEALQGSGTSTLIDTGEGNAKETDSELDEKPGLSSAPPTHLFGTLALDDPQNPINWPKARKIIANFILCTWVLTLTYSSTAYVSSISALEETFDISEEGLSRLFFDGGCKLINLTVALVGVTLTVFGFAAGPLIFGPMSQLYGRQIIYRICAAGYSGFSFGMVYAPNITTLLICRFFVGFWGSASINNVPASIGDFTTLDNRLHYTSLYALMAFGGPSLGPLVSAFIQQGAGYRWNFLVMAIFSTVLSVFVALVPETHGPTLHRWRENDAQKFPLRKQIVLLRRTLAIPVVYLFAEPLVSIVSIYLSILYGILYGFFEEFGVVFRDIRGFSPKQYGLTYIALGLGFAIGTVLMLVIGHRLYERRAKKDFEKNGAVRAEARLELVYYGAILNPISLFLFAWTAPYTRIHWILPCIAEGLFSCSVVFIFTGFIPFLIDCYTTTSASALAAGMASRALIGSVFPLFSLQLTQALTVQGATSLLAGIACCLTPIPFVFRWYGPQMRARSKHSTG
ncbi:MFS transporter [Mycena kentingensis (nom. inval.)]|nr:MFS transporter [Mycena kentingensis (nom. inval.)]